MSARAGAFAAPGAARREKAPPSPRPGDRGVSFVMVDPLTSPFDLPVADSGG
jgi:hypothetical protein